MRAKAVFDRRRYMATPRLPLARNARIYMVYTRCPLRPGRAPHPIQDDVRAMLVQFAKWGNSLAVRIPAPVLKEAGVGEGTTAELRVEAGKLILSPIAPRRRYALEELVAGITEENRHHDIEAGPPVGNEVW